MTHVLLVMLVYARRVHERLVLLSPFMRELGKTYIEIEGLTILKKKAVVE
jgi:hypothetical protein